MSTTKLDSPVALHRYPHLFTVSFILTRRDFPPLTDDETVPREVIYVKQDHSQ